MRARAHATVSRNHRRPASQGGKRAQTSSWPRRGLIVFALLLACAGTAALWSHGADSSSAAGPQAAVERMRRRIGRHVGGLGGGSTGKAGSGQGSSWCYALAPKQRTVYEVSQTSQVVLQPAAAGTDAPSAGQTTGLQVAGELHQVVHQHGAKASILAVSLLKPSVQLESSTDGQRAAEFERLETDLVRPIYVRVQPNRRVERFYYGKDTSPLAANVLKSLFLSSQIVLPGCGAGKPSAMAGSDGELTWELTEDNATGKYTARYQARPNKDEVTIYKQKQRYLQLTGFGAAGSTPLAGSSVEVRPGSYTIAGYDPNQSVLSFVEQFEELRITSAGIVIDVRAETRLDLVDFSVDPSVTAYADAGELIDKLELKPSSALDGRQSPEQKRALWERTVGSAGLAELLGEAAAIDASTAGEARYDLFRKFGAYFNLHPDKLGRLTDAIVGQDPQDPSYADKLSLLAGVFTSVEDAAAEKSLLRMIEAARHRPQAMTQAIGALGDLPVASREGLSALRQIHQTDKRPENRDQALLAIGAMAHRAAERAPELQAEATEYLMDQLQSADGQKQRQRALAALGNAGATEAFEAVLQQLGSASPQQRAAAVHVLRRMPGEQVDAALRQFLSGETNTSVLQEGLQALSYRPSSENLQAAMKVFNSASSDQTRAAALQATADLGKADRDQTLAFFKGVAGQQQTYSERVRQMALKLSTVL